MEGLCGGIMRGSGRGRRLNLDFPSSSSPELVSSSWAEISLQNGIQVFALKNFEIILIFRSANYLLWEELKIHHKMSYFTLKG